MSRQRRMIIFTVYLCVALMCLYFYVLKDVVVNTHSSQEVEEQTKDETHYFHNVGPTKDSSVVVKEEVKRKYNGDRVAVICYIPPSVDEIRLFISLLYGSWRYITDHEEAIKGNRTFTNDIDLMVFAHPKNVDDLKAVCEEYNPSKINDGYQHCWIVVQDFEINIGYGPINSFIMFNRTDIYGLTAPYKYLMRTDYDAFLTPALYVWKPKFKIAIGSGGYSDKFNMARLKNISRKLGMIHQGMHHIGSTWYGETDIFIKSGKKTLEMTAYMFLNEFDPKLPGLEKIAFDKNIEGQWIEWWRPVSLLYGAELSLNHLVPNFTVAHKDKFDTSSCHKKVKVWETPHVHCWHDDCEFQKFRFITNMRNIVQGKGELTGEVAHRLVENTYEKSINNMTINQYSTFIAWNSMGKYLKKWF